MTAQTETKKYTPAEYLELEIASETRNESRNGQIIPMTGGTPEHNDIAGNLYVLLKLSLKGKAYRIFYVAQRLWLPEVSLYTYPDIMVLPKRIALQNGRKDTFMKISSSIAHDNDVINPLLHTHFHQLDQTPDDPLTS